MFLPLAETATVVRGKGRLLGSSGAVSSNNWALDKLGYYCMESSGVTEMSLGITVGCIMISFN